MTWRPIFDAPGPVQEYARQRAPDIGRYGVIGREDGAGLAVVVVWFAPSGYWHDALWCELWVPPLPDEPQTP